MMPEDTFTLEQAERELARRACSSARHAPYIENADYSGEPPAWYCRCGEVVWRPAQIDSKEKPQ